MTDGPKVRMASPREVFNVAILCEYFVGDLRTHTEYLNGKVPCSFHIHPGTSHEEWNKLRDDGDICPDIWSIVVLYSSKSDPDDPELNRACQYFDGLNEVQHIWILEGGYERFNLEYGENVCIQDDLSIVYPAHVDDKYQIYLSGEYVAKTRTIFSDLGITHVLNVAREASTPFLGDKSLNLTYMHIPLIDDESQDVISVFHECISFIDECLHQKHGKVLVHCVEGKSRSAIVAAAYLVAKKRISADEALQQLRQARPIVSPNRGFVLQLQEFDRELQRSTN